MSTSTDILLNVIADTGNATTSITKLNSAIGGVGLAIGGLATAFAVFSANSQFVQFASEFEAKMLNINSLAQMNTESLNSLSNSVVSLSNELQTASSIDLASSLYDIQSAGFSGADGLKVLKAASLSAAAGQAENTVVTNALVKSLNAMGKGANEATNFTNIFQKTVAEGIVTMPELASVIGNATGLASSLNVTMEDLGASIALMTKRGLSASDSVTKLNSIFSAYIKPSGEAVKLAKELNLEFNAVSLKTKGWEQSLKELMTATGGNTESLATLLGSSEAVAGALKLGTDNGKDFSNQLESIKDNSTAVADAFNEQAKSFQFAQKRLEVLMNNFKTELGEVLQTAVKPFIDGLIDIVEVYNNLDSGSKELTAKLIIFTPIVFSLTTAFIGLGFALPPLLASISTLTLSFVGLEVALAPIVAGLGAASATVAALGLAFIGLNQYLSSVTVTGNKFLEFLQNFDIIAKTSAFFGHKKTLEDQKKQMESRKESLKTYISLMNKENRTLEENEKLYSAIANLRSGAKTSAAREKYLKDIKSIRLEHKQLNNELKAAATIPSVITPKVEEKTKSKKIDNTKLNNQKLIRLEEEKNQALYDSYKNYGDDLETIKNNELKKEEEKNQALYDSYKLYAERQENNNKRLVKAEEEKNQSLYNSYKKFGDDQQAYKKDIEVQNQKFYDGMQVNLNKTGFAMTALSDVFESSSNESIQSLANISNEASNLTQQVSTMANAISRGDWFTVAVTTAKEFGETVVNIFDNNEKLIKSVEDGTYSIEEGFARSLNNITWFGGFFDGWVNDIERVKEAEKEKVAEIKAAEEHYQNFINDFNKKEEEEAKKKADDDKKAIEKELEDQKKLIANNQELYQEEKTQRLDIIDLINKEYETAISNETKLYNTKSDNIDSNIDRIKSQYKAELNGLQSIQAELNKSNEDLKQRQEIAKEFSTALVGFKDKKLASDPDFLRDGLNQSEKVDFKLQRDNILDLFDLGEITLKEKQEKEKQLALERFTYFDELSKINTVSTLNRIELEDKARESRQEFFELSKAQKEEEANRVKLNQQEKEHQEKMNNLSSELNQEINNAKQIEGAYYSTLDSIDNKFTNVLDSFKNGAIDVIRSLGDSFDNLADKLTKTKNSIQSNTKSISSSSSKNTYSGAFAQMGEQIKRENKSSAFSPADNPASASGLSHHNSMLDFMKRSGVPLYHDGGIFNNSSDGLAILRPKEAVVTPEQQQGFMNYIKNPSGGGGAMNINIGQVVANNPNEFTNAIKQNMPIIKKELARDYNNKY